MLFRHKTALVIIACIVLLLAWEVVVLVNTEKGDTISAVIADAAMRWPIIPFFAGMLIGHFFWPNNDKRE